MKKFFKYLIGILILLFAALFFASNMMAGWVSKALTEKAGVEVNIGSIRTSLISLSASHCKVYNVPRSILEYALKIGHLRMEAPVTRFFQKNIVIDEVILDNIYIGVEIKSAFNPSSNWNIIMTNLDKASSSEPSDKTVLIKKLILNNIQVDLVILDQKGEIKHLKPIPRLEFDNIGTETGLPSAEIMQLIMNQVLKSILSPQGIQDLLKQALQLPGSPIKESLNPFGIFSYNPQESNL